MRTSLLGILNVKNMFIVCLSLVTTTVSAQVKRAANHVDARYAAPEGCPFVDDYGTVNMRLNAPKREKYNALAKAVFTVLALPGAYRADVVANKLAITSVENLQPWPEDAIENLTDLAVSTRLAQMGLTLEVADDTWAFAMEFLKGLVARPQAG
ncbi:hypothetical protein B0H14DRAFT_3523168 [Mycena olivaceomarginata]|nr:hypothetical protein B0H14DRAFT_3523168 [Mycena olivaceomarginata]